MQDFDNKNKIVFVLGFTGEVLELSARPSTVGEAEMLALAAVRKKTPKAARVSLVRGDDVLRNGYPVLGDAEVQAVVVDFEK